MENVLSQHLSKISKTNILVQVIGSVGNSFGMNWAATHQMALKCKMLPNCLLQINGYLNISNLLDWCRNFIIWLQGSNVLNIHKGVKDDFFHLTHFCSALIV